MGKIRPALLEDAFRQQYNERVQGIHPGRIRRRQRLFDLEFRVLRQRG